MFGLAWSLLPTQISNLWLFLTLGSVSAMLFSMAKTGFGGSIGLLAVPVMIYACGGDTDLAVGILLPMLIVADYAAVLHWRRRWDLRAATLPMGGAVVGVGVAWGVLLLLRTLGAQVQQDVTSAAMKIAIGLIALSFVVLQVVRTVRNRPLVFRPRWPQATLVGLAAGFCSTLSHAAGPIVAMYMLSQQMPKGRYVATTALFFWTVNQVKLIPYGQMGMINTGTLGAGLVLAPGIAAGALLGLFLHRRLGVRQFHGIVYTLLGLAGFDLIRKGLTALLAM